MGVLTPERSWAQQATSSVRATATVVAPNDVTVVSLSLFLALPDTALPPTKEVGKETIEGRDTNGFAPSLRNKSTRRGKRASFSQDTKAPVAHSTTEEHPDAVKGTGLPRPSGSMFAESKGSPTIVTQTGSVAYWVPVPTTGSFLRLDLAAAAQTYWGVAWDGDSTDGKLTKARRAVITVWSQR